MIVSLDIAVVAGGETSVWGLPLTVSVGCHFLRLSFILPGKYRVITLFLPGISDLGQRQVKFPYPGKITPYSALHLHTPLTL